MLVDRQTMIWRRALDCNPGSTVVGDRDAGTTWRLVHALVHAPRSGPAIHLTRGGWSSTIAHVAPLAPVQFDADGGGRCRFIMESTGGTSHFLLLSALLDQ